ncbi:MULTISPECIES: branched-chain amino acid ABC transporter substrate-binding protein [unclassified Aureimonas]|uniref:branched-chain amino acid ABC transporter substrate-binding protein n=1 Tax=unclassified Aureimonas TaxID=2615206 RepID=UPI0006F5589D|nr:MULTISPECIES: branched-chain amino acid ABC transporter substrate-binding protein [unclassified Aureimonas]KQT57446.1 hypothetical protein ASG62_08985 [Aureimonas sp. Leaf427]KQT77125.1 hypothetical protein ASG54_12850 [Aureimonas sp. Leaf460]
MATRTRLALAALLLAGMLPGLPAARAAERVIAVAAPMSGPSARLGQQMLAGGRQAVSGRQDLRLVEADTACTAEGGRAAASRFVAEKAAVVTGFLCTQALEAALPILTAAQIPVITSGVRALRFTDRRARTGALLFRIAPRADAPAEAMARAITERWRDVPFALVDDGTVEGRGLADAIRIRLEATGLKPALIDTFRPADDRQFGPVRRVAASGVSRLLIAGDRPDVAIIARDAAASGLSLEIMGGETLLDEAGGVPLPAGTLAVAPLWRFSAAPGEADPEAPETREGYFGPSLAATEIAVEALAEAERSGKPLADVLGTTRFSTSLGPVRFDAKGDSSLDLFRVHRFDGTDFVPEAGG